MTPEQLTQIERSAQAELAGDNCCVSVDATVALGLVAAYRAALEWKAAMEVDDYRRQDKACTALAKVLT